MLASTSKLRLPLHAEKPRRTGLTIAIDGGLPVKYFCDVMESHRGLVDFVKFGWGTALVTAGLPRKIAAAKLHGVECLFGGTLFEKFYANDAFPQYIDLCREHGISVVEISSGSISVAPDELCPVIESCRNEGFFVFAEIGHKDPARSETMDSADWIRAIKNALGAGAHFVVLESREAGTTGICSPNGEVRCKLIESVLASGVAAERLVFEAPQRQQQVHFISRLGSNVNLANIAPGDLVSLETLRQGLRFETFGLSS